MCSNARLLCGLHAESLSTFRLLYVQVSRSPETKTAEVPQYRKKGFGLPWSHLNNNDFVSATSSSLFFTSFYFFFFFFLLFIFINKLFFEIPMRDFLFLVIITELTLIEFYSTKLSSLARVSSRRSY